MHGGAGGMHGGAGGLMHFIQKTKKTMASHHTWSPTSMSQKSSAKHLVPRVFAQKGLRVSIFGHRSCPFPGNFLTLVQTHFEI
jgi:hypothetical protein